MVDTLDFIHGKGYVVCDLKPSNIMIILEYGEIFEFYFIDLAGFAKHMKEEMKLISPLYSSHFTNMIRYT